MKLIIAQYFNPLKHIAATGKDFLHTLPCAAEFLLEPVPDTAERFLDSRPATLKKLFNTP